MTKAGHIINRTRTHTKAIPDIVEDYLGKEVDKNNVSKAADRFSEHTDELMKLYEHEQPMNTRAEDKRDDVVV